ncbi:MAG TPA: HNH endonuclease [Methylibium sp.]|nr:HNH endonuclease [Methylibium sp.]
MPSKRTNPKITATELRELVHYDQATGVFTWKVDRIARTPNGMARVNARAGDIIRGTPMKGEHPYLVVTILGRVYLLHRLAFLYVTGEWPKANVDHRDGNCANNAWKNLREAAGSINQQNLRGAMATNKVGLLGVTKINRPGVAKPFRANIRADGRFHYLGAFPTAEEAHQAYLAAKRRLHEGCTL